MSGGLDLLLPADDSTLETSNKVLSCVRSQETSNLHFFRNSRIVLYCNKIDFQSFLELGANCFSFHPRCNLHATKW